jgi:predicted TIM-barrel fold metal-dependent hydrolase
VATDSFPIIDCDVHPSVERGLQGVFPYLPEAWRQRLSRKRAQQFGFQYTIRCSHPNGTIQREDARPSTGKPIASDPAFVLTDLADRAGISTLVLNSLEAGALAVGLANIDESIVLASAFNDYLIERWLSLDRRFTLAMTVPSQDPVAAAAEIARIGAHPQVVAVSVPPLATPLGHRRWWPIFEAAQAHQLPIYVHGTGTESIFAGAPQLAAGVPDSYIERYVGMSQVAEANITSLVFNGTFEKFPALQFLFVEFGFLWVLPLVWRMDRAWRHLRREVPWVKKSPVDYVRERCRFSTQPMDEPSDGRMLDGLLQLIGCEHLCFSTDYPHWDNEMPDQVLQTLAHDARERVFGGNARATLRLS